MIYSSDLGRARETAGRIAAVQGREIPVVATPDLRECNYGLWEGLPREEIIRRYAADWQRWLRGDAVGLATGGEDFADLARRVGRAFQRALGEEKTLLISAHRGPLQAILCAALGVDAGRRRRLLVANCSLTVLTCDPGQAPRLTLFNDIGHLDGV